MKDSYFSIFTFFLIPLMALLSCMLLKVPADYEVYVEDMRNASSMSFIEFLLESRYEYGYNCLLYLYSLFGAKTKYAFAICSNLILYSLLFKIVANVGRKGLLMRNFLLTIIVFANPLFFVNSVNAVRQLLAYTLFFAIITSGRFLRLNWKQKSIVLIIPPLIHLSSFLLSVGYLFGCIKIVKGRIGSLIGCVVLFFVSRPLYDKLDFQLFHTELYDAPRLILLTVSAGMLVVLSFQKIRTPFLYPLLFPVLLVVAFIDLTQFSSRMILIIHFIYFFFVNISFRKIDERILASIATVCICVFVFYVNNFLN